VLPVRFEIDLSAFLSASRERYFSPTPATNSLTRALVDRMTPEWKAFAYLDGAVFTAPSPTHLAATWSQVETGLTARLQLQPYRSPLFRRRTGPVWGHYAAAFSTAYEADDRPLTLPSASRVSPGFPGGRQDTRTAATHFASTKKACSIRSAFSRQVPGDPLYASSQTRHRTLGFATEGRLPKCFHDPTLSR